MSSLTSIKPYVLQPYQYETRYQKWTNGVLVTDQVSTARPSEVLLNKYNVSYNSPGYPAERRLNPTQLGGRIASYGGTAVTLSSGSTTHKWTGRCDVYFPAFTLPVSPIAALNTAKYRDMAEMQLRNSLNSGSINLAVAAAERAATSEMLVSSIVRFGRFVKLFRQGKVKSAFRRYLPSKYKSRLTGKNGIFGNPRVKDYEFVPNYRTFSSLWLETFFGWSPFLSDIYGAAELLANTYSDAQKPRYSKVTGSTRDNIDDEFDYTSYSVTVTTNNKVTIRAKSVCLYTDGPLVSSLLSSTGISNPLLVAWELVPLSFVVDWFVPVGNYLGAMGMPHDVTFHSGSTSVLTSGEQKTKFKSSTVSYVGLEGGWTQQKHVVLDRYVLTTFPSPKFPFPSSAIDPWKAVTSLALIQQIFKSKG